MSVSELSHLDKIATLQTQLAEQASAIYLTNDYGFYKNHPKVAEEHLSKFASLLQSSTLVKMDEPCNPIFMSNLRTEAVTATLQKIMERPRSDLDELKQCRLLTYLYLI